LYKELLNIASEKVLIGFKKDIALEMDSKNHPIDHHFVSKNRFLAFLEKIVNNFTTTSSRNLINKFQNIKVGLQEEKQNSKDSQNQNNSERDKIADDDSTSFKAR
jgi:hypothetical protein